MTKKKELSPELKAECDAAKALFVSKKNALGLTQASLAEAADISAAAVAMYLNGTNPLNAKFASVLSRVLGVPVEKFSKRLAKEISGLTAAAEQPAATNEPSSAAELVRQMLAKQGKNLPEETRQALLAVAEGDEPEGTSEVLVNDAYKPGIGKVGDEVWIAHYDVRGALGGGEVAHDFPEMLQDVRVSPSQLRSMGVEFKEHYHLKVITGWGQSMTPTIKHGDPCLVDISIKEFIGDGIYYFSYQGFQYIKRLQMKGKDKFKMISDNRKHKAEDIFIDETYIQARVLFVWNGNLV
ncbi:Phage repressor protein C, contains Cro/C1-type HTH and peptisase s24 domains [Pseudomonas sp. NFACC02]|uniref:S24 family peptidase n=1 Tax=Pseudomonas sp. NFACC02 TaxID=1566250 RepID=UPI0008BE1A72|nr:S24 family peptidase [Pseudomonas sp. NFACC02]SEQ27512.1 Phage repressor protein C, contains Cro/C1-type HTH and peptisase s24 domains [Pseudomonas sp. NFACC02]